MYAIIRSGGKQTKVREGDVINVERLRHTGQEVTFTPILVVDEAGDAISERDALSAITVRARVLGEVRGEKVDVFKFKSKTGYRRSQGHRQTYTTLEVTGIEMPGAKKKSAKASVKAEAEEVDTAADEVAPVKPTAEAAAKPTAEAAAKPAPKRPKAAKVTDESPPKSE